MLWCKSTTSCKGNPMGWEPETLRCCKFMMNSRSFFVLQFHRLTHKQSKTLPKLFLENVFTVGLWIGHVIIDSAVWVSLKFICRLSGCSPWTYASLKRLLKKYFVLQSNSSWKKFQYQEIYIAPRLFDVETTQTWQFMLNKIMPWKRACCDDNNLRLPVFQLLVLFRKNKQSCLQTPSKQWCFRIGGFLGLWFVLNFLQL